MSRRGRQVACRELVGIKAHSAWRYGL